MVGDDKEYILTFREQHVLGAIVRNYILNATPTGSRILSKQREFGLSPATIRNVMADLEERGYITQPHTSAGRVPTDKGYRFYVDTMMEHGRLPDEFKFQIRQLIGKSDPTDLHLLMDATSRALSLATRQLGVILTPRLSKGIFRHLHIFEVEPRRHVLHVTVDSGFVRTMTVEVESDVGASRLENACAIINERFYDVPLSRMCNIEKEYLGDVEQAHVGIIRLFIPSIRKMLEQDGDTIYAEGETNIVIQPEFVDKNRLGAVIELLSEKKMLMHLFEMGEEEAGKVIISIGAENENGVFESFSVLKTKYRIGNLEGSLGVLGPKRMPYPFLVSAVNYTARLLGRIHHRQACEDDSDGGELFPAVEKNAV